MIDEGLQVFRKGSRVKTDLWSKDTCSETVTHSDSLGSILLFVDVTKESFWIFTDQKSRTIPLSTPR